jgi:hypothetical protein
VRGLEILVAGDKVLRWGFRRQQIKKHPIKGITDGGRTRDGDDQIGLDSKIGQKRCGRIVVWVKYRWTVGRSSTCSSSAKVASLITATTCLLGRR